MALDEKAFVEEIDVFITSAEEEVSPEPTEAGEAVTVVTEGSETTYDLPSEDEQEKPAADVVADDADHGDPGAEPSEDGTEGDTSEAEVIEPTEPAPAAPAIGDAALTAAVQAGISIQDARSFDSEESLLRMTGLVESLVSNAQNTQQELAEPAADPLAAIPDLDPEEYDPKTVEMFAAMKGVLKSQQDAIASFQESQDATMAASQAASDRDVVQWFDSEINKLEFKEALGEGSHGDQTPGSSQLAKRDAIAKQCSVQMAGYEASGQQSPTREEIFRASARLVLTDEYQALHDKEVSAGLSKRAGQHIHRAGGKKTKSTQSPEEHTAALLDEKYG